MRGQEPRFCLSNAAQSYQKERLEKLSPEAIKESKRAGETITAKLTRAPGNVSGSFLILLNANHECVSFRLSARARDQNWELVFDTSSAKMTRRILGRLTEYPLQARSVAVLRPEPASLTNP